MPGVYVAPSIWRQMDVRTATAVFASIWSNPTDEHVIWEPLWNDALISRSRSLMATKFMTEPHLAECDVMVIVDDDVVWQPKDFWKIVEGCRETRSIYGGVYVTRSTTPHISSRLIPGPIDIRETVQRRPKELEYLATGFMAIHRDVFAAMIDGSFEDADGKHRLYKCSKGGDRDFWPFFSPFVIEDQPRSYHYLSEDWAFGERARQLGFKAWYDESIVLQHMGLYPFTVGDLQMPEGLPSTGTDLVETRGHNRLTGDELVDSLVDDIAEWSDDRPGDVRQLMAIATEQLARLWNEKGEESEEDWYRRDDVGMWYILDLANWHVAGGGVPREYAEQLTGKMVLDLGAGIGTFALQAARAGAAVDVVEPNEKMREFLIWRAVKHGLDVHVRPEMRMAARYDIAVAWHVFEHLADPELALWRIARCLTGEQRWLLTQSDFNCNAGNHPQHHEHDDFDEVLRRQGFGLAAPHWYEFDAFEQLVNS